MAENPYKAPQSKSSLPRFVERERPSAARILLGTAIYVCLNVGVLVYLFSAR
jgi:hypothetical protein